MISCCLRCFNLHEGWTVPMDIKEEEKKFDIQQIAKQSIKDKFEKEKVNDSKKTNLTNH